MSPRADSPSVDREIISPDEMRAAEAAAIGSGATTGSALMEVAGEAVVAAALARWPALEARSALARSDRRVVVFCGPGANGGDGYVIARRLAERGWRARVSAFGDPADGSDAARAAALWRASGGSVEPLDALDALAREADLVVDAGFGTGLRRPLPEALAAVARRWAERPPAARLLAVDAPSGLSLDTGRALGPAFRADLTVTFHRRKHGHVLADGPSHCGELRVVDIGVERHAPAGAGALALAGPLARLGKDASAHKFGHGHCVVMAGPPAAGGAARLAARAALRVGAGLVTVGAPSAALVENAARLDAVMLRAVDDPDALAALLGDPRVAAVALGPGLGVGAATRALIEAAARRDDLAMTLDADALTSFAEDFSALRAAIGGRRAILTPHAGEFSRLFPDLAERARDEPGRFGAVGMAREAAARSGATVVLKGPSTLIAGPDGALAVNAAVGALAAPWLATAGAGDVLTGLAAGLLARGNGAFEAAASAVWLHAETARAIGPGLIAEDLPDALPRVMARVLRRDGAD